METINLQLVIDGVPYAVKATPYSFNSEKRFKVHYDGDEYIFAYDSQMSRYTTIGDGAENMPDRVESEIAGKLGNH